MPAVHSNSLKVLVIDFKWFFRISSLITLVKLIQYRRDVGMFNDHNIAINNSKHPCLRREYQKYDAFTSTIELIIVTS